MAPEEALGEILQVGIRVLIQFVLHVSFFVPTMTHCTIMLLNSFPVSFSFC